MKRLSFFITLLIFSGLACSVSTIMQDMVPSKGILYQDKFDDPKSGWGKTDVEAGLADYGDGAYRISVKSPNVNLWAHPGMDFSFVHIEVDATAAAGPQENRLGLICRMKDNANFYYFIISTDGYYGIGKVKAGKWSLLNGDQMKQHNAIHIGSQMNHLRADCIGNLLILYVNDQLVGSAEDSDFTSGDVGVLAGAFGAPGVDVYFDNFVVYKP